MQFVQKIGSKTLLRISRFGKAAVFLYAALICIPNSIKRLSLTVAQIYSVGALTTLIIVVAGGFVGMVLGFQGYYTLVDFGAESSLGLLVALSLTRELGPVLSALLFTGRAGSALTAEIGLMKATDQLAALEMMGVDPIKRIVAPRLLAGTISVPLLCALFTLVGIFGGYFAAVIQLGVDSGIYWTSIRENIDVYHDIANGLFKSLVFGVVVTWIAVFEGYSAYPSAEGVSRATTRTVVAASLAILGLDYVLTALMFGDG